MIEYFLLMRLYLSFLGGKSQTQMCFNNALSRAINATFVLCSVLYQKNDYMTTISEVYQQKSVGEKENVNQQKI